MKCRICKENTLVEYLDLGDHPPSDAFLDNVCDGEQFFPLAVLYCPSCSLSQLSYVAEDLYNDDYPYETRMNTQGVKHFRSMAYTLMDRFSPEYVVDIGSNDGTLLERFLVEDYNVCGIEPVYPIACGAFVYTINDFFNEDSMARALRRGGRADLVTATNVFAHIDDLHEFMDLLFHLLAPNGVFVIEAPYFVDMIKDLSFDTIYHEHLSYLSIKPLVHLFRQYDMEIFDVEKFTIHCGTMRYYIAKKGVYKITNAANDYFGHEMPYHDINKLYHFAGRVSIFSIELLGVLHELKSNGNRIVGVSAPAKGNTLLNFCKIGPEILDYITEKSDRKIGRFTPGMKIPVVEDARLIQDQPDYALILAHNWSEQIINSLGDYRGRWIIPNEQGIKDLCQQKTLKECALVA